MGSYTMVLKVIMYFESKHFWVFLTEPLATLILEWMLPFIMCWTVLMINHCCVLGYWCFKPSTSVQKQVKNNVDKNEQSFGVILTPFSSSKWLLINWQKIFWLMISMYKIWKVTQKVLLELSLIGHIEKLYAWLFIFRIC